MRYPLCISLPCSFYIYTIHQRTEFIAIEIVGSVWSSRVNRRWLVKESAYIQIVTQWDLFGSQKSRVSIL
jgi:hypothetical protein